MTERHPTYAGERALERRYLAAQLAGDRREALRLVLEDGLRSGLPAATVRDVIRCAQRQIGVLWQENRISIAEEHMATAISQLALAHLYQHAPAAPANGKKVLVACVDGELHEFPARLVADALDLAGFTVKYLGASVPNDSLVSVVKQERPDLLALSATMSFHAAALEAAVTRIRTEVRGAPPIAIGGQACDWAKGLAARLGVEASGCSAEELVAAAERLLLRVAA
jgi:methanogenic corrinoid protein MtbC1